MRNGTSRREFVAKTLGGVAAASLALRFPALGSPGGIETGPKTFLRPFDYEGVTLRDGPMKAQFDTMRAYYYAIPDDDILNARLALQDGPTEWMVGRPGLEFAAPGQPEGVFLTFYKVGADMPYNMYFDLES